MRRSLRDLAEVHYGKSPSDVVHEDGSVPVVGTGGAYGRAVRALFPGPAVVVPRKGSLGNPQYIDQPFWAADTTYAVLPKKGVNARWLYYNLAHFDLTRLNEATGVPSISRDWLYKVPFEDPGVQQQERLAEILATVDEAIIQSEALIAKRQRIKEGLMHDFFSRGSTLDGLRPPRQAAPHHFKESRLGWVPKEWDIMSLGQLSELVTSGSRGWGAYYAEEGAIFLRIGNLTREHPNLRLEDIVRVRLPASSEGARTRLAEGDVLISITADLGIVGVIPPGFGEAYVNQHIALIRPRPSLAVGRWLGHWLGGAQAQALFRRLDDPGAKAGLNLPTIRAFPALIPSKVERDHVVDRLDAVDAEIHVSCASLVKLRQLKLALMQDLLTGCARIGAPADVGGVTTNV